MKRLFYIFLMMVFFVMLLVSLYFCIIYGLVMNHVIPLRCIITFTDMMLSPEAYGLVMLVGVVVGYFFGKRWWQIIYVDKVYYFDTAKNPVRKRRTKKVETE